MSIFERYGNVYRLLINAEKRWEFEKDFLLELTANSGACQGRILDLACGTGFHANHLARQGYSVQAVDMAESMLAVARADAPETGNPSFKQGDVCKPVPGEFDLVLLLGNTLCALDEPQEFFTAAAAELAPEGSLLVQIVDYQSLAGEEYRQVTGRGIIDKRDTVLSKVMVPLDDGMVVAFTVQQEGEAGWACFSEQSRLYDIADEEIMSMSGNAGFTLQQKYSGMDRSPYRPGEGRDRVFHFIKQL